MHLDYSKLEFDEFGRPEVPELMLQTLSGKNLGVVPYVSDLHFNIKFSELSEISFKVPRAVNGEVNPLYNSVTGYKLIYTKNYGVYLVMSPTEESDGMTDVKDVTCYSREKLLDTKRFFLAEGTYNFWNPASPNDTLLGMMLEGAIGWHVGYVSPALIGRYRTFDEYDDNLLSFAYNNAPEKYRCVFVFDPYEMAINVYDADEERPALPIYLDFDNLLKSVKVEEMSEELVTAMRPYGADSLDIRSVNPIGTNWLYDLSYFIGNGSIEGELAEKWETWQYQIESERNHYNGLVALQASTNATLLAEQAALTDLNGELTDLTNQQSITIQAIALESTEAGKEYQQNLLDEINTKISAKNAEISQKEADIAALEAKLDTANAESYSAQIAGVVNELAFANYFTEDEQAELSLYMIEQDLTESTFVATDVDTTVSGQSFSLDNSTISVQNSTVIEVDLTEQFSKRMFTLSGGTFTINGAFALSGDIIRGTIELADSGSCVCSIYAGLLVSENTKTSGGMLTITGNYQNMSTNVTEKNENEIITLEGSEISFVTTGSLYLTADISEFQKYAVQLELLDFARETLADVAVPTYEFSVESGNFIFAKEFAPFKDKLELGKGIYLRLSEEQVIAPLAIELELDFEDRAEFSLVFSNRFKRHDNVNTLKDLLEKSYSTSRSIDASKYIYNRAANTIPSVTDFMQKSIDAANNSIVAAANQSVLINGAGIQVGGDSKYQIRIIDNMIAMSDDNWQTSKLAIGRFCSDEVGEYWGVNAEVIGGKLLVGNNLIIEDVNDKGVMTFRVDASGAWLYNASIVMQDEVSGTQMILAPEYGFVAGKGQLYTTDGTTIIPTFLDEDGNIKLNNDGTPTETGLNLYFDSQTGDTFLRGTIVSGKGKIGGWTLAEDFLYSGSGGNYVALNASGDNENSVYAMWAGAEKPAQAPFWVKKNGDIYCGNGTFNGDGKFTGTVQASEFLDAAGNSMMTNGQWDSEYLNLRGLTITDGDGNIKFQIDDTGKVTINDGSITFNSITGTDDLYNQIDDAQDAADSALATAQTAQSTANSAQSTANIALSVAQSSTLPDYIKLTYIDSTTIQSPLIQGNNIRVYGTFQTTNANGSVTGYMGAANGMSGDGTTTYGVAMSNTWNSSTYAVGTNYVIVTNGGVRMQAGNGSVSVVDKNVVLRGISGGASVSVDSEKVKIGSGAFVVDSNTYGSTLPSSGITGQVFFKLD